MEAFSDPDTTAQILSLLPTKSLMAFKCTAKRWYNFVSDPLFLRIYHETSKQISKQEITPLLLQHTSLFSEARTTLGSIDLFTLTTTPKTNYTFNYRFLDFLPEKVAILSSSNGILCCRTWVKDFHDYKTGRKKFFTYICNPITRRWVQLRCKGDKETSLIPGLAFYPFGSSSSSSSMFKLVNLKYNSRAWTYSFQIYSSDTNNWKTSKEICKVTSRVCSCRTQNCPTKVLFVNGWLHWLTPFYQILAFNVEKDLHKLIDLPRSNAIQVSTFLYGICCWGESEGYFHYVYAHKPQLQVWVLKNYEEEPVWELKYSFNIKRFRAQHPSVFANKHTNSGLQVFSFHEDVLYFRCTEWHIKDGYLVTYDFRTSTLIDHGIIVRDGVRGDLTPVYPFHYNQWCPLVLPFSASLLPPHELAPIGGVRRSERNRKRKLALR